jgi:DNA-binding MarR family transcriptional regulator
MTPASPDLETVVGYRLKHAQSVLRSVMDASLRPLGLTTAQYVCLELLSRAPGSSNSELARAAFVTRQTMNGLLAGLRERGLIERTERAPVGRALPTALTAAGRTLLAQATDVANAVDRRMVSRLSPAQVAQLQAALASCIDALTDD